MPTEIELLRSLDDEPRTPSTVDVRRAIVAGRRRRARRAFGYAGAAAVTALAVAGASIVLAGPMRDTGPDTAATGAPPNTTALVAATPPTSCTLERLPAPDGAPMALVTGADPTGRYIVGRTYPKPGGYQAVIWHNGAGTLVMLPGDLEESLTDVNTTGTAVGWSYIGGEGNAHPVPYVYRDGTVSQLPGVRSGSAYAINDDGVIVGADDEGYAVRWPSATEQPTRLPMPPGTKGARASDIDEDGTVVGAVIGDDRPYVWFPDGTHRQLAIPTLDGKPAVTARVASIRQGWATGVATNGAGRKGDGARNLKISAVRWNVHTGEVRLVDGLKSASATNAHGWQVGGDEQNRAVLVADGKTVPLPELHKHEPGGLTNLATTLSDDGRTIGGQSDDASGTIQAVVWRCR
ncbi:hypothetical protein [Phytohabitans houttuyneae]|uniref:Uncharacterized protein n=1 Tax=Phytohabitans houttuyneae TaxID=1076126 RepID=A0A6V8KPC7_9ACTN|nr:hypothetical protein [Phytohabitans houttuyneae]GFJ82525.1 hypothetical protein Phou_067050 [Phytohabitans houttuyneae]